MDNNLIKKHCVPCEAGTAPFTDEEENEMLKQVQHDNGKSGWLLVRDGIHKITRQFKFGDFREALGFVNKVGSLAEEEGHHPDIKIVYNRVTLDLFTHAIGGLSENDFILAAKIEQLI